MNTFHPEGSDFWVSFRLATLVFGLALLIPKPPAAKYSNPDGEFNNAIQDVEFGIVKQMVEAGFDPLASDGAGYDYLRFAISADSVEIVDFLLELGVNPNPGATGSKSYGHCLSNAAWIGNSDIVELLLNNGADVYAVQGNGETALHEAASGNSLETVKLLVEAGARLNLEDTQGNTPLNETLSYGIPEIAVYLIQQGADPNHYSSLDFLPLGQAVLDQNLPMVQALVGQGVDLDMPFHNGGNYTSINYLWRSGSEEIAQLLVDAGANLDVVSGDGYTPLQQAVYDENERVAKILLAGGAEYDIYSAAGRGDVARMKELVAGGQLLEQHHNGLSVIQWAGRQGHKAAVRLLIGLGDLPGLHCYAGIGEVEKLAGLLQRGANINEFDTVGYTPLHYAVANNQLKAVEFLIANGAAIDAADRWYDSPLEKAIYKGLTPLAIRLVELGAKVDGFEGQFSPPIHCAIDQHDYELVTYLLEQGADMYITGVSSWLPLENAIMENDLRMVKLLLDAGYDVDALNTVGKPAMAWAMYDENIAAIRLLLENGCDVNLKMPLGYIGSMQRFSTHIEGAYRSHNQATIDLLYEFGAEPPHEVFLMIQRRGTALDRAHHQRFPSN